MVVESFEPGYLAGLGLGYEALCAVKPDIILTSITGFGQTGPWAHYKAPDIVGVAIGGIDVAGRRPPGPTERAAVEAGIHLRLHRRRVRDTDCALPSRHDG